MQTTSKFFVSLLLCLTLFPVSGCGSSSGGKNTAATAREYVEAVIREEKGILNLDSGWSVDDFNKRNPLSTVHDKKKDGTVVPKPGFEHTGELASKVAFRKLTLKTYADGGKSVTFKTSYGKKVQELIGLAIDEIENAGEQSSVFDDWKRGGAATVQRDDTLDAIGRAQEERRREREEQEAIRKRIMGE